MNIAGITIPNLSRLEPSTGAIPALSFYQGGGEFKPFQCLISQGDGIAFEDVRDNDGFTLTEFYCTGGSVAEVESRLLRQIHLALEAAPFDANRDRLYLTDRGKIQTDKREGVLYCYGMYSLTRTPYPAQIIEGPLKVRRPPTETANKPSPLHQA